MKTTEIKYYEDYISPALRDYLIKESKNYKGVEGLVEVGVGGGLEDAESLSFLCKLYDKVKDELKCVLDQRIIDREFIDKRVKACYEFNEEVGNDFTTSDYNTILGLTDSKGRIVIGPLREDYYLGKGDRVSSAPEYLAGNHVTLFGPPDSAKLSINAMNAYHRKLVDEPKIVGELLSTQVSIPKWGADDEDSKTPLRKDLASAGENLTACFEGTLKVVDEKRGKIYELSNEKRSLPIKRFPGLALPSSFLFYNGNPLPLHLYDFALHLFHNWHNEKALTFYVPKLENEEEARYIKNMIKTSEEMINKIHPEYKIGSIRLLIVLENPRAVFRVNEMMDELYPYFAGASLGWHDYLGSTARLFKEDPNYRIPVKADPDIVIKHIKGSHQLLADVVGARGGIKIGGMYGILPITNDIHSDSFQISIYGFIKDVVTQMKRGLDGFWVAHPDFMRIGLALVEAWKQRVDDRPAGLEKLVKSLLQEKYHEEIFKFINGEDIPGLNYEDKLYDRDLIVADIKESSYMRNNDPIEVRYNVFQSLQYLTDWLSGNGCVALPAIVGGEAVRVMDDLATAERSRWEVWHEIYHGRFTKEEFLKIAHEEMDFIRKDLSNDLKIVQVKWNERTEKWYPVAFNLMVKLMTDKVPVEFATELLIPFGVESIRESSNPWEKMLSIDSKKYSIDTYIARFNHFFDMCGSISFATEMAKTTVTDLELVKESILNFNKEDVIASASFHGNIGENKKTLDKKAQEEQRKVIEEGEDISATLRDFGQQYLEKFGIKFLVSAKGKSGQEMLEILKNRFENSFEEELTNAKNALFEITKKRLDEYPIDDLKKKINNLLIKHEVKGLSLSVSRGVDMIQSLAFGTLDGETLNCKKSLFEIASLSKSVGSAFAIEYFRNKNIPLSTSVNSLLESTNSKFRLKSSNNLERDYSDDVCISHLMSHSALNMHYVNGVPADNEMPTINEFLMGNDKYEYDPIEVINPPGEIFKYSGAGFIVLEHLIESLEDSSIINLTRNFLDRLGMSSFTFDQVVKDKKCACGFLDDGSVVEGSRKMFPSFAAGAMSTSNDVTKFLNELTKSFQGINSKSIISSDTAIKMLHGTDKGCLEFMGSLMGLGVFVVEAGDNKFALHQGANDGFRSIYVHCYDGPDLGVGFSLFCNGDNRAVPFLAEVSQILLKELSPSGVDFDKFKDSFSSESLSQEEIVNIGYKSMIFDNFKKTIPEEIVDHGPLDDIAEFNKLSNALISKVTNQKFARAENLISPFIPVFDPTLFGKQGKIMDSWESVRHNPLDCDSLELEVNEEFIPKYISISTKWHLGNQAPEIYVEGFSLKTNSWFNILENTKLEGHSLLNIKLKPSLESVNRVKVSIVPDGGLSRLYLFDASLPESYKSRFEDIENAKSILYKEEIPHTDKPMHIDFCYSENECKENVDRVKSGQEYNCASAYYGAKIVSSTNEHYGPASQVISPYPPISMFDGLESARSREVGHFDEVEISLSAPNILTRVELDFEFFVNNNPLEVELEFLCNGLWVSLIDRENVKGFAGKTKVFEISSNELVESIRLRSFPDGGLNRLRAITAK
jgi:malate synthase/allantoicase/CubicO group peptidase (beta-lactamase class C family)